MEKHIIVFNEGKNETYFAMIQGAQCWQRDVSHAFKFATRDAAERYVVRLSKSATMCSMLSVRRAS